MDLPTVGKPILDQWRSEDVRGPVDNGLSGAPYHI